MTSLGISLRKAYHDAWPLMDSIRHYLPNLGQLNFEVNTSSTKFDCNGPWTSIWAASFLQRFGQIFKTSHACHALAVGMHLCKSSHIACMQFCCATNDCLMVAVRQNKKNIRGNSIKRKKEEQQDVMEADSV
jgi:hypothetical protein